MAIWRARGGRSVTTRPPMRTSPSLGGSSPAIMRSSVVLPQPEGPSKTRNSPSRDARSMPSTATTPSNRLLSSRTSTVAMATRVGESASRRVGESTGGGREWRHSTSRQQEMAIDIACRVPRHGSLLPTTRLPTAVRLRRLPPPIRPSAFHFSKMSVDLRFGLGDGIRGAGAPVAARGHHVRQDGQGEDLAHRRVGWAGVAEVRRPVVGGLEQGELVRRLRAVRIGVEPALRARAPSLARPGSCRARSPAAASA